MKLPCLCLLALFIVLPTMAAELTVDLGHGTQTYSSAQLLARADARDITIPADVAFKRSMHYRAVPLRALLVGVKPGEHLQFVAADGFAAELDSTPLLSTYGAQAWLARVSVTRLSFLEFGRAWQIAPRRKCPSETDHFARPDLRGP